MVLLGSFLCEDMCVAETDNEPLLVYAGENRSGQEKCWKSFLYIALLVGKDGIGGGILVMGSWCSWRRGVPAGPGSRSRQRRRP